MQFIVVLGGACGRFKEDRRRAGFRSSEAIRPMDGQEWIYQQVGSFSRSDSRPARGKANLRSQCHRCRNCHTHLRPSCARSRRKAHPIAAPASCTGCFNKSCSPGPRFLPGGTDRARQGRRGRSICRPVDWTQGRPTWPACEDGTSACAGCSQKTVHRRRH